MFNESVNSVLAAFTFVTKSLGVFPEVNPSLEYFVHTTQTNKKASIPTRKAFIRITVDYFGMYNHLILYIDK